MKRLTLQRYPSTDEGTFGQIEIGGHVFHTGELPWRDNRANLSCVPSGVYLVTMQPSVHFKRDLYHLQNVPNRTDVMIHSGNFCGDALQGYEAEVRGCLLIGNGNGTLKNESGLSQCAILGSKSGLADFENLMGGEDFELEIVDAPA